jgi:transcriptional regulator with XRE-family HTH domain
VVVSPAGRACPFSGGTNGSNPLSSSRESCELRSQGGSRTASYVSRLERGLENPTVAMLEQLADALGAKIVEFFVVPAPGEPLPKALRGGRRPKR